MRIQTGREGASVEASEQGVDLAHFKTCIETSASAEDAFDYLADFSNAAHWDPSVTRAEMTSPAPVGLGSRFEIFLGLPGGREARLDYRITRYEPGRCLVFEADTRWLRSLDTIEIERRAHGCRVHYDADLRPRGAAYLLDLPIHLAFQVSGARSVEGLEHALGELGESDFPKRVASKRVASKRVAETKTEEGANYVYFGAQSNRIPE
jgi:hypothetical protein